MIGLNRCSASGPYGLRRHDAALASQFTPAQRLACPARSQSGVVPPQSITALLVTCTILIALIVTGCSIAPRRSGTAALIHDNNLSAWRVPAGDWQLVGGVKLDPADPKKFITQPGAQVLFNGTSGRTVNLLSAEEFADCQVHVEFCVPHKSNSGIYLLGRYEVQILDSWGVTAPAYGDCGGIYKSCSEPKPDSAGTPPRVNASKPPGEWQSFDITFRAPRFDAAGRKIENARFVKVLHNGIVIHENVESERPTCAARWLDEKPAGPIMLQGDHGPVAYRNLTVRRLHLK